MISRLLDGNKRFVQTTFDKDRDYFAELAKSQNPTVLWIGSLVPALGDLLVVVACCVGVGALVRTRFDRVPPPDAGEGGPYRVTAA